MRWSRYNHLFRSERLGRWVLYNSASGALLTVRSAAFKQLRRLQTDPSRLAEVSNAGELLEAGFFVLNDDAAVNKLKLQVVQNRLSREILDLTVVPTLACNFRCSYCFQRGARRRAMDDRTEENLVRFVRESIAGVRSLRITWFGGEPLLELDRIVSFYRRLRRAVRLPFESHVITNGSLLSDRAIRTLDALGVTFYQITLDGLRETHDRRRLLRHGGGTFDTILRNIEALRRFNKATEVAIRINVDRDNAREYHAVYREIERRFGVGRIHAHPGFVDSYAYACACASGRGCNLERDDRARFFLDQYKRHGIYSNRLYPVVNTNSCMARFISSWVVGPRGELYKCLSVVGVPEMAVGNVNNEGGFINDEELLVEFLKGDDYLDRPACRRCLLFPACDGGCPYLRMKAGLFAEEHDTCHVAKGKLDRFLEAHIEWREMAVNRPAATRSSKEASRT